MLKKKLMSLGIAVVFTLSSLTTTVFAADFNKAAAGAKVSVKFMNPGKGNGNSKDKEKDKKDNEKKYKFDDCANITWALNAIEKMTGKGILGGIGQGKFAPRNNTTHVEALAMVMRLTGDAKEAESLGKKVHPYYKGVMPLWGYGYIYIAIEKGILLPEELKDFNPNKPAKRHEIAKYIIRAMGKTEEALEHMDEDLSFKDSNAIPEGSVGYVYLVNELKIMTGNDNNFKPNEPVTRAEMAVLLDRAEGKFDLTDTENKKNGTVFVSADADDNEITVKVKGSTVTYEVLEDVQVYRDGSFETIEDLVEGDILQLTLNDDKEVIFIEVVKDADDNDDTEETEVSFSNVSYNSLPQVLKDEVDDLKSAENYEAYEYNGYIYLLAAMGKKNTGGYDIDIEKVYRVENDDEYTIKAVVDIDEPSSNSFVTQSVTYPYSVVKFKGFDDIENVIFVDDEDDELDDVEITDVDETEENEVSFEAVDYSDLSSRLKDQIDYLKLNKSYKAYEYDNYIYLIAAMGKKNTGGYEIDIEDVYKLQNGSKYTIKAVVDTENPASGSSSTQAVTYPYSVVRFKNFNNIDTVRFVDEDNNKLSEIKIVELDEAVTVEGIIDSLNTSSETIKVKKSNGSVVTPSIPDDAEITVNDDKDENFSDLEKGMTVEIEIIDERVTKVVAEDNLTEVEGTLTGISISTEKKITLKVGSSSKTYTVASDVKVVIDDETARVEDLRVNDELTLKFSNGELVEIEKE
ncbi:MAG TPA: protease complex subunit PrcB family protein [Clostridia bacterium]|nr:protease complex subunit PrcB family protein [Clostridia bacterium]